VKSLRECACSLTSIRKRLNEHLSVSVSNRSVKLLIIELYGYAVCFTYAIASNKRISQMILSVMSNPASLLESMRRVSPVQQGNCDRTCTRAKGLQVWQ
jgi:hypothetical protein